MGGERFESSKPDAYLFGENEDLNFLGSKPTPVSAIFNTAFIKTHVYIYQEFNIDALNSLQWYLNL